ncbi:hypothetical protein DPMN_137709 [Dreissena polymorpha]|uniref:Uncharacterized protein n=1 Tax=Dreissena polymorpha TaxID=45954 RepID=A0A9D4JDX1_DREPO|nr:hypothetical protein DPMN_137709 [Dreissena polymorpha]
MCAQNATYRSELVCSRDDTEKYSMSVWTETYYLRLWFGPWYCQGGIGSGTCYSMRSDIGRSKGRDLYIQLRSSYLNTDVLKESSTAQSIKRQAPIVSSTNVAA